MSEIKDWFDENIPDQVLQDESWDNKYLPDINNITKHTSYNDMSFNSDLDYFEEETE